MNNDRRTRITDAMEHLSLARDIEDALGTLDTVVSDLEDMESSLEECKA